MSAERIHRTVSADGTEIAGRVVGQGPPLVLLHGALYCGETAYDELIPHLTDHFTCLLPSTRGRGLSADSEDFSSERLFEDAVAFLDSIGEPVPLFGWSQGGMLGLGVAAFSDAVSALVAYEPAVLDVADEEFMGQFADTLMRMNAEMDKGQPAEAARQFMGLVCNHEELEESVAKGRHEIAASSVPADLRLFNDLDPTAGPSMTDPDVLATITVPILLLQGSRTIPWFERGNQHVTEHAPNAENRIIPGAGHAGPGLEPGTVAAELIRFLQRDPAPA